MRKRCYKLPFFQQVEKKLLFNTISTAYQQFTNIKITVNKQAFVENASLSDFSEFQKNLSFLKNRIFRTRKRDKKAFFNPLRFQEGR